MVGANGTLCGDNTAATRRLSSLGSSRCHCCERVLSCSCCCRDVTVVKVDDEEHAENMRTICEYASVAYASDAAAVNAEAAALPVASRRLSENYPLAAGRCFMILPPAMPCVIACMDTSWIDQRHCPRASRPGQACQEEEQSL